MSATQDLLERVRAATGPDRKLDAAIIKAHDPGSWARFRNWASMPSGAPEDMVERDAARYCPMLTASLDAALALVERLLPNACPSITRNVQSETAPEVLAWSAELYLPDSAPEAFGHTPALALLAALLVALGVEEK